MGQSRASRVDVNLFDAAVIADPHATYDLIRAAGRVVWNGRLGAWMVTGYDDCVSVLTDHGETFAMVTTDPEVYPWFQGRNMVQADGAEHVRLRRCLTGLFTRQAVAVWEGRVAEVVDRLLQPLAAGAADFDLIADFTMIPTVVVADMLGVPRDHHEDFRHWSHAIASNLAYGHEDPDIHRIMRRAGDELNAYVADEIARHRRKQPDDLITAMLGASDNLTEDEIRSTSVLLLLAGYDTTAKLMGNCLVALAEHPDQRRLVAEDPSLVPAAIEEVLRWTGVSQMSPRRVMRDVELAGTLLRAGETVYAMRAAANRDPHRWSDPHRFDVRRPSQAHLGFGFGPHLCLGAPLARLETKVAVERLLAIAPEYRLQGIDYGLAFANRGPERGVLDAGVASPLG